MHDFSDCLIWNVLKIMREMMDKIFIAHEVRS